MQIIYLKEDKDFLNTIKKIFTFYDNITFHEIDVKDFDQNKFINLQINLKKKPCEISKSLIKEKSIYLKQSNNNKYINNTIYISFSNFRSIGRMIISKNEYKNKLDIISGRRHRIYSSFGAIYIDEKNQIIKEHNKSDLCIVKYKRLDEEEIKNYSLSNQSSNIYEESKLIEFINGSYQNIIFGIPILKIYNLLKQYKIIKN